MVADIDGSLYLSRFNGDTNEIYRLRKNASGSCEAVLIGNFGSGVWPALLGGVEASKDEPVTPLFLLRRRSPAARVTRAALAIPVLTARCRSLT